MTDTSRLAAVAERYELLKARIITYRREQWRWGASVLHNLAVCLSIPPCLYVMASNLKPVF